MSLLPMLLRDDRGATAVEYGLILALIGVAIVAGAYGLGGKVRGIYEQVTVALTIR